MSLTDTIFSFALNLLYQWNYPGVFLLMTLEGATFPVPSEVVLPLTGFLVYQGNAAVLLARFVPLLRTLIAFPAGTAKMKIGKFLAYSTVGIIVWDIILIYLGVLAGQNASSIVYLLDATLPLIGYAAVGGIIVVVLLISRRHGKKQDKPGSSDLSA